jgi:DNA-binding transcriptional MerR regulator
MNTKEISDLLGVVPNTIRRWCEEYHQYLSPTASPPKGKTRVFTPHDLRVLHYVSVLRDKGEPFETVAARLQAMHSDDWADLPDVPPEWLQPEEQMPVTVAASKAYDVAQIAVLQRELEFSRRQLTEAKERVSALESELHALRASSASQGDTIHTLELELNTARGQVAALEARLSAYAITGGDNPIPVAAIIVFTALVAVAVVAAVFVLARLLL